MSVNGSLEFQGYITDYNRKPLLSWFWSEQFFFQCCLSVLQRQTGKKNLNLMPFWTALCVRVQVGVVISPYLPVFSIQPVASPCQQAEPSCGFLPVISKCFKEHGHLLLEIFLD